MSDRMWSENQLRAGLLMMRCTFPSGFSQGEIHPFSCMSAMVGLTTHIGEMLNMEGSARLFGEQLCSRMGYNYNRVIAALDEEICRQKDVEV